MEKCVFLAEQDWSFNNYLDKLQLHGIPWNNYFFSSQQSLSWQINEPSFMETKATYSSYPKSVHIFTPYFPNVHFNIILKFTTKSYK